MKTLKVIGLLVLSLMNFMNGTTVSQLLIRNTPLTELAYAYLAFGFVTSLTFMVIALKLIEEEKDETQKTETP